MARFEDHIRQAEDNLGLLEAISSNIGNYFDWQVTICFYTALHLVNAHLSKFGLTYRQHTDVNHALNPQVSTSLSKLPEDEYVAYIALQQLSRRSRYLVNEKIENTVPHQAYLTYDKHLAKALRHLDRLIAYFNTRYSLNIKGVNVVCPGMTPGELKHIQIRASVS